MNRHAKAASAGSTSGRVSGFGRTVRGAFACLLALLAFAGIGASFANAAVPAKGVTGFFGSAGVAAGQMTTPRGVAVSQSTGNVYAVDGANNRVVIFDSTGKFLRAFGADVVFGKESPSQSNEVQAIAVAATSGTFALTYAEESTTPLAATATAAEVQSALNALGAISAKGGSVTVTGGPGNAAGSSPYRVLFNGGALANKDVAQISVVNEGLTGGTPTNIAAATVNSGSTGLEICVPALGDGCKEGINKGSIPGTGGALSTPQGIAINQANGDVYVTDQANLRVQQYDSNGNFIRAFGQDVVVTGFPGDSPGKSAVQTLTVTATGGKYTLAFGGKETAELAFDATAAQIQTALQGLSSIGAGNATLSETAAGVFKVSFTSSLANNPEPLIVASSAAGEPLTGGTASVTNATTGASGFEVCSATSVCKSGASNAVGGGAFGFTVGHPAVAPAGSPNAGNVLVADPANRRVQEFSSSGAFVRAFGPYVVAAGPGNSAAKETQTVAVKATGGKYALSVNGTTTGASGAGTITSGSNTVTAVSTTNGAFAIGQVFTVNGTGITAGTTITGVGAETLTLSAPATASAAKTLTASNIPFDAPAAELQGILNALPTVGGVGGSVSVTGGPGDASGSAPYSVTFEGTLAGDHVNLTSTAVGLATGGTVTIAALPPSEAFETCVAAKGDACKAGTAGSATGQFATATPTRVAEDAAGNIYTVEPTTNFRVQKFTLPANVVTPQGVFAEADLKGTAATSAPTDVAIDPSSNRVLVNKAFPAGATASCPITGAASVAESRVVEVSAAGALEGTHGTCAAITPVNGLALRGSSGDVYVSSTSGGQRLYVLNTGQPQAPSASISNISGVSAHSATITALINPNGPESAYGQETSYRFEYKRSADPTFTKLGGAEGLVGNRTVSKLINGKLDGLRAGTSYDVRVVATKGLGSGAATSSTLSFNTSASTPDVRIPDYVAVSEDNARLEGTVNPNNSPTGYHFDYVDQASFEANGFSGATQAPAADAGVGSGTSVVAVSQEISGLQPGTSYRFRLVAANGSGQAVVSGAFSAPDHGDCPNAPLRAGQTSTAMPQGSTFLPSCMALEMVSPPKKYNQPAKYPALSASGDRVKFQTTAAVGDPPRLNFIFEEYVASRGDSGWSTAATAAPPSIAGAEGGKPCALSSDLSRWNTWASSDVEAPLSITRAFIGSVGGGPFTPISPLLTPLNNTDNKFAISSARCEGGSIDASHEFFKINEVSYLPGDPVSGKNEFATEQNTYEAYLDENGVPTVELLQRDKNGVVHGGGCGGFVGGKINVNRTWRGAISPDASRVYFTTRPSVDEGVRCETQDTFNKYRIMKKVQTPSGPEITSLVSSECARVSPACVTTNGDDTFLASSREGDKVFFETPRQLTSTDLDVGTTCSTSSTPGASAGCDLYLHDSSRLTGSRLTQVSAGDATAPSPGRGGEVMGIADVAGDGSHVYFVAAGVLTTAPNPVGAIAEAGKPNLYLYQRDAAHPSGRTAYIGTLNASEDYEVWGSGPIPYATAAPALGSDVEDQSIGGDGHVLVFYTKAPLTPDDTDGGARDVYRFDSSDASLERVSKAAPGGSDNGSAGVAPPTRPRGAAPNEHSFGRTVSEDGRTIVFFTTDALDPGDSDGTQSAYVWHDGEITAIPTGSEPTISMSGQEVAFVSESSLLPQDGDTTEDVYVGRTNDGFPPPPPPTPCQGEACQGTPTPEPGQTTGASATFSGPGNVKKATSKPKAKRKHNKRHKKKQKNRASRHQGGQK